MTSRFIRDPSMPPLSVVTTPALTTRQNIRRCAQPAFAVALSFLLAACGGGGSSSTGEPPPAPTPPPSGVAPPPPSSVVPIQSRTITLITGDKVRMDPVGDSVSIEPRAGREHVLFFTRSETAANGSKHVSVVPQDAQALIASGKLDSRLFDVTMLLRFNYHDGRLPSLPIIVSYRGERPAGAEKMRPDSGAAVGRELKMTNSIALAARKSQLGAWWDSLQTAASTTAAPPMRKLDRSIRKIWLDGLAQVMLDGSVAQIGAPAAWAQGYTGDGVIVAVADTGIDPAHPDFAGRIVATGMFPPEGWPEEPEEDTHGHGTHIASIIAGSGAASTGRYRGVAPDASLVSAKVCFPFEPGDPRAYCPFSSVIAGAEWAVAEQGARIVNLSIGEDDQPEIDLLEETVNRLTADYGALFVVSAGSGDGGRSSVTSPATADAALAVGAVDRDDEVTSFSARGPRRGDGAVKPEILAPGVDIVAARASQGVVGTPADDSYTAIGGTSAAAAHVAGAAAVLAERHPDWTAAQLKAALMGSARFDADYGVHDQGSGRVDVAAAVSSSVLVEPASLGLGLATWPHAANELSTRVVTYRNVGATPVTLSLQLDVLGPESATPPAGMFDLQPTALTIAPGDSGTATLTVDTRTNVPSGTYEGRLIAADAGVSVHVPITLEQEDERYDVVLSFLDGDGAPTDGYIANFKPADAATAARERERNAVCLDENCADRLRLAPGRYLIDAQLFGDGTTFFLDPRYELQGPATVVFDQREAVPLTMQPPTTTAQYRSAALYSNYNNAAEGLSYASGVQNLGRDGINGFRTRMLGEPSEYLSSAVDLVWNDPTRSTDPALLPTRYAGGWVYRGTLPTNLEPMSRENMALVRAHYENPLQVGSRQIVGGRMIPPWGGGVIVGDFMPLPSRRMEYYFGNDPGIRWSQASRLVDQDEATLAEFYDAPKQYLPGAEYSARWHAPLFAPLFPPDPREPWVSRRGDTIAAWPVLFSDNGDHGGIAVAYDSAQLALYRDGELVEEIDFEGEAAIVRAQFDVPPEAATYRLAVNVEQQVMELARQISAEWTFSSAHVEGESRAQLPIITVGLDVNERWQAVRGVEFLIPLAVRQLTVQGPVDLVSLQVEASFDDGETWSPVRVSRDGQQWSMVVAHPARADYVSLRIEAQDHSHNRVRQTIVRAYPLADASAAR